VKLGLVLGGGGLIGLGFHSGVLRALRDYGVDASKADVIVGTSAGAIVAAYLAAGWPPEDFFEYAHGRHPNAIRDGIGDEPADPPFARLGSSPGERFRRRIGSAFAMASARGWWRAAGRRPPSVLRRAFPAGLYSSELTRTRFRSDLPGSWPDRQVVLSAAELYTGTRVGFGLPGGPTASFPDAVLASTAIPGIFPPVKIGGRHYVDGGVVSGTSLDLATAAGCDAILCIAPLAYQTDTQISVRNPQMWSPTLVRRPFERTLRREVQSARVAGVQVFVIKPWTSDLLSYGTNSMRRHDRGQLAESARLGTERFLDSLDDHPVVSAFAGA
jgi:NTE family protein